MLAVVALSAGLPLPFLKTDYRARLPVAKFCINEY
jgi:hypothetical protein